MSWSFPGTCSVPDLFYMDAQWKSKPAGALPLSFGCRFTTRVRARIMNLPAGFSSIAVLNGPE